MAGIPGSHDEFLQRMLDAQLANCRYVCQIKAIFVAFYNW
jgi:hypothetical protein